MDKELFFGLGSEVKAAVAQLVTVTDQASVLPVTTRGIGVFVEAIIIKLYFNNRNIPNCTPWELYRVSLAQLDYKLIVARRGQLSNVDVNPDLYQNQMLDLEQREKILGCQYNFGPIAHIISAIGNFEYADTTYYPRVPKSDNPVSQLVTFSNLRMTVRALSNVATARGTRLAF